MEKLSRYEKQQLAEILKWKEEGPGVANKAFGVVVQPLAWLVDQIVPDAAIRGALDFSSKVADWLADTSDIVRDASVDRIDELQSLDLELSDKLADEVHNWAIGFAVVEGAGTGAMGLPGTAADIPALITLALRTIHKIGICYGYETTTELDRAFVLGILAASAANDVAEKVASLAALRSIEVALTRLAWKEIALRAAERQMSKEGAIMLTKNLAKQLGVNLTKRKALAAIPYIGALIGGSVNGWYIKDVGWVARRAFQERWFKQNGKIDIED